MYINFWYPAAASEDVGDAPVHAKILSQDFVLFRDTDGKVRCLSNVCVHRGGSLAHGKIKGACIECPYHGWQFDGEGMCTRIPSMGREAKIPTRARIDSYPTEERYGLVFAFLGDLPVDQRPPLFDMPEYDAEGWHACKPVSYTWKSDYRRQVENVLDPGHAEFVHTGFGFEGEDDDYHIPHLEVMELEWGAGSTARFLSPEHEADFMRGVKDEVGHMVITGISHGPASTSIRLRYKSTAPETNLQYLFDAPIDSENVRTYIVITRNFALDPEMDENFRERTLDVTQQDQVVVERMVPRQGPLKSTKEVFVPADNVIVRYRELLNDWEARGWRIDDEALARHEGKTAFAIPSPARRHHKGWALDPIPLLAPRNAATHHAAQ